MTNEDYKANREAGHRGQGSYPNLLVSYTPADKVVQGEYGSRKARREYEPHLASLARRRS